MTGQTTTGKINHNGLLGDENKTKIHSCVAEKPRRKGEGKKKSDRKEVLKITFKISPKSYMTERIVVHIQCKRRIITPFLKIK